MGRAVAEKRRTFEEWLQRRDRVTYDRNWQSKLQKEWRTGDGESDWGMISRVTKDILERGKAIEER